MRDRVTEEHLESVIVNEAYFTAAEGALGEKFSDAGGKTILLDINEVPEPLKTLTFCVLILKNGFTVTGESACVSAENFNAEIGRRIARENAINKLWGLEGYLLRQENWEASQKDDEAKQLITENDSDC